MLRRLIVMAVLGTLVMTGCSDEQKEDATKLEQELLQMQDSAAIVDTTTLAETTADTVAPEAPDVVDVAAVPEETVERTMPARSTGDGYTLQVAGCESREYADYLIELYQQRGYEPYMTTFTVEGQLYYRVRIGSFETRREAIQLKNELAGKYSVEGWVDTVQ